MVVDCVDILDHALVLAEVTHNPLYIYIHIGVLYAPTIPTKRSMLHEMGLGFTVLFF